MNNGKLQAKQEKLKSLHCPSPQSFLFNSRGSSLRSQFPSPCSHSSAPNSDRNAKSSSFSSQHNSKCATPSPQNIKESETGCSQRSNECVTRCLQHNGELAARSPQHLFIDVSTELLRRGQSVRFRAPGLSMHPAIKEEETITVVPISSFDIKQGDILLYIVGRKIIAHRVVRIRREKSDSISHSSANSSVYASNQSKALNPQLIFILRGDASRTCDDPVETQQILGKVISVEKRGRRIDLYCRRAKMLHFAHARASRLKRLILRILG